MLSPDDLSRAGEEVAAVYRQIEDSMVDALAGLLVSGETRSQRFETAMQLLSQSAVPRIHEVMERNRAHIDAATRSEVGRWLALSDSDDLSRIKAALGVELPGITTREAASVVEGVAGILSRDNLEMERGAAQAFLRHSTWAVTQVSSGAMTAHAAWREAAVNLAGEGITHVTYRDTASGRVTVTNHADVAVRRHIRSQLSQATMSRTLQVCREAGIGLVEVSSHTGARPTHAEWHGRVYSLDGDVTVDGRLYKDFWRGTGYQGKEGPYASLGDRLGGVNCRHAFGPWLPGTPRAYDPDPPHPSGLSNDEVYELTQKQRAQERRIRATKRELMVAREHAEPGNLEDSVRVAKLEKKLKRQQAGMRKLVDDANAKGKARVLTRAYPRESVAGYRNSTIKRRRDQSPRIDEDTIEALSDVIVPRSLGAASPVRKVLIRKDQATGESLFGRIPEGSRVTKRKQIAGKGMKRKVDEAQKLTNSVLNSDGIHVNPSEWRKMRGNASVEMPDGSIHSCEVHFYWSSQTGDIRYKIAIDYDDELWRYW